MPGPPPPPPMGAPPMPPPTFAPPKGGPDDRSALLKSIQKGAKLKKTVTVDKSAPLIPGKVNNTVSNNNTGGGNSQSSGGSFPTSSAGNGLNLGGLFAGGMPKLRPTGKLTSSNSNNNANNNDSSNIRRNKPEPPPPPQPGKNFSNVQIQHELKKQMASDNKNRGPPPPAPTENYSEDSNGYNNRRTPVRSPTTPSTPTVNGFRQNQSSLHGTLTNSQSQQIQIHHRKAKSNVSLNHFDTESSVNGLAQPTKPVISYGKPNLAPKPPTLNGKPVAPPKKLLINGKPVSRAHSMKSPRSPSPQSPDNSTSAAIKFGTVRNISSVIGQTLAYSTGNLSSPRIRPQLNGRPTAPPPSIPTQQAPAPPVPHNAPPPPPPSKTGSMRPPNHAPPPPPQVLPQPPTNHAPPIPTHRTQPSRAPPAVPGSCAPPPPPRHSSMATVRRRPGVDLEERYRHMFQQPNTFPKPPPYRHLTKIYACKQAGSKQPAPQPPNMQQIPAKTWGDTSSAC